MGKRIIIITAFISFSIVYIAYEAYRLDNKLEAYSKQQSVQMVKKLPQISFKYFNNPKEEFDLVKSALEGNHLFIHFWATWCAPCEKEFPDLMELTKLLENKKNVKFLFVAANDDVKKVRKFLKKFKKYSNFVLLVDNDFKYQKYFNTFKLPETYLFGANQVLINKFVGPQQWTQKHFVDGLNSL